MKFDKKTLTNLLYVLFAAAVIYVIYTYVDLREGMTQHESIKTEAPPTQEEHESKSAPPQPDIAAPSKQILQNGEPSSLPYAIPLPPPMAPGSKN